VIDGEQPAERDDPEVAIVGAGPGGLVASIFLARAGWRVVCVEPEPFPHARVGESLDWSSPRLLEAVGLPRDLLVGAGVATYKRSIAVEPLGGAAFWGEPADWVRTKPLGFEVRTLHVDRVEFDQRLFEMARGLGVRFIWERVARIETAGERVSACLTTGGRRIAAPWFIDASGQAQLFARAFKIPRVTYGRRKVCLWTYFESAPRRRGTTFFTDNSEPHLVWIWDIPITPSRTSIGCVMAADQLRARRDGGQARDILRAELARHPRFGDLLREQPDFEVFTCSYQSYVSDQVCGPNWLMVGESASLPDPATANGVTAALRHAQDAAGLLEEARGQSRLSQRGCAVYTANVRRMGEVFNHCIETVMYDWPVRWGLGLHAAVWIYTVLFSYGINALYARIQPRGWLAMACFGLLLADVRGWMTFWSLVGRVSYRARRLWQPKPIAAGGCVETSTIPP
jgi:menaquinone-9 beta-reductase